MENSKLFLGILCMLIGVDTVLSTISVNKITVRTPKDGDIGLIFDISIINTANEEKELLEYYIRPATECCVNLTNSLMMPNAGKIIGGSFGYIEPGAMQTISVIWPTTYIFNRVGHCQIIITSTNNAKNENKELIQELQFDTRFTEIDATGTTFRKRKEYIECSNWDMDFLNNCAPVKCEEKYLGKRSFYNTTTKMCESTPKCLGKNQIYDIYANECMDSSQLMDAEDIENIKRGKYENYTLDLSRSQSETQHVEARNADHEFVPVFIHRTVEDPMWIGVLSGLSIVTTNIYCNGVVVTIIVYMTVCFLIFIFVNSISKNSAKPKSPIIIRHPLP